MTTLIDSKTLVFELVKSTLNKDFKQEDYFISDPTATEGPYNTQITLSPYLQGDKYGTFKFNYNRVDIRDIERVEVSIGSNLTIHDLLPQIAEKAGLGILVKDINTNTVFENKIETTDIINQSIPALDSNPYLDFQLETNYKSYIFYGILPIRLLP